MFSPGGRFTAAIAAVIVYKLKHRITKIIVPGRSSQLSASVET
jgi:hypothetical protein